MTWLIYSFIAGAALSVLWLTFRFTCLRRLTHFALNRWMLIGILFVALSLPVVPFMSAGQETGLAVEADTVTVGVLEPIAVADVAPGFDWSLLQEVYLIGTVICALWMLAGLAAVFVAIATGRKELGGLIVHARKIAPFTWGRWIVVPEAHAHNAAILRHERAHLGAFHWVDLLLCRVAACLLWYWPTVWMLSRELHTIHEYEADRSVLNSGVASMEYQVMLVNTALGRSYTDIVNPFNYHSLKKRIIMMKKKSSSGRSRMRALALLPALAALVLLVSTPAVAGIVRSATESVSDVTPASAGRFSGTNAAVNVPSDSATVYETAEIMPKFQGGEAEMYKWLSRNIRYPDKAVKSKVQGRVVVAFVVEKDGSIGGAKVVNSVDPDLDAEALRVIRLMPKLIPGKINGEPVRVRYTMPVTFKIQ